MADGRKHWIPLEANPDVLDSFAQKLGVQNLPTEYKFCDIYGLDDDLLAFVPQPVLAVLLLFPITPDTEALRAERKEERATPFGTHLPRTQQLSPPTLTLHPLRGISFAEQEALKTAGPPPASLYYMKQTIGNACGTIGLLHSVANCRPPLVLSDGSFLQQFFASTEGLTPEERGAFLENPPADAPTMDAIHEEAARQGATEAPAPDADVDLHFVAFVLKGGHVWELDGRKAGPVDHGTSSEGTLLKDVAAVVKKNFVERANSLNFSLIALAGTGDA